MHLAQTLITHTQANFLGHRENDVIVTLHYKSNPIHPVNIYFVKKRDQVLLFFVLQYLFTPVGQKN